MQEVNKIQSDNNNVIEQNFKKDMTQKIQKLILQDPLNKLD